MVFLSSKMESCFPPLAALSLRSNSNSNKSHKNRHSTGGTPQQDCGRNKEFMPKLEVLQDLDLYYIRQIASSLKVIKFKYLRKFISPNLSQLSTAGFETGGCEYPACDPHILNDAATLFEDEQNTPLFLIVPARITIWNIRTHAASTPDVCIALANMLRFRCSSAFPLPVCRSDSALPTRDCRFIVLPFGQCIA